MGNRQARDNSALMGGALIRSKAIFVVFLLLCGAHGLDRHYARGAAQFEIEGYFLGATPQELNMKIENDPRADGRYHEAEAGGVKLFFVKVQGRFQLYRIIKEQDIKPDTVLTVLDNLKARYGTPDSQQIKTRSIRPQNRTNYVTTVRNRAVWNISGTQEFIAEVESTRVVYELLDKDPENVRSSKKTEAPGGDGSRSKDWKADF